MVVRKRAKLFAFKAALISTFFLGICVSNVYASTTYKSECADLNYFIKEIKKSPVEFYAAITNPKAVKYMFSFLNVETPHNDIGGVIFLYNPQKKDAVGIIPLVDGCALKETYLGLKIRIDQVLAALLHKGHEIADTPDQMRKFVNK